MSETTIGGGKKTFPVRLTDQTRAELEVICQLTENSPTEEVRIAVDERIAKVKADPAYREKAKLLLAQIEQDAQSRREAIDAIFSPAARTAKARGNPAASQADS